LAETWFAALAAPQELGGLARDCSFVSLAVGCFSPPGIPNAAHQGVADPNVITIEYFLEDELDLFDGQSPSAESLHDDAEGALDAQAEFLGLLTRKLVVEKHPVGRFLHGKLDCSALTDVQR